MTRWVGFILLLGMSGLFACRPQPKSAAVPAAVDRPAAARYYVAEVPGDAPGDCSACGAVELMFLDGPGDGPVDHAYVADLGQQLRDTYGIRVDVRAPSTVPAAAFDTGRDQYDGAKILDDLQHQFAAAAPVTRIALMNEDIYFSSIPEWRWAFGGWRDMRESSKVAIISASKMAGVPARRRMLVMVGKYIGLGSCGFELSEDPQSIMFHNVLSAADLDGMSSVACFRDSP